MAKMAMPPKNASLTYLGSVKGKCVVFCKKGKKYSAVERTATPRRPSKSSDAGSIPQGQ
jgi:hypothetical protein